MKLNELQKFIKNFFFKIFALLFASLIKMLLISHLSDVLLVNGFGRLNFIEKYSLYFLLFSSLGMDIVAIRLISVNKNRLKEIYSALVPLKLLISLIFFIIMVSPMLFVPKLQNFGWVLVIFSSVLLTIPFSVQPVFEAVKRLELPSIIETVLVLANYLLVVYFVNSPDAIINVAVITVSVSIIRFLSHNIIFIKLYGKWKPSIDIPLWKNLLTSGIVIGFIQVTVMMLHYFDVFMLGFMKDDSAVGLYSAAYHAMFMVVSLMGIFHNLMNPILFENYRNNPEMYKNFFNKYIKFIIYLGCGVTVIFIILAIPYLNIFYNLKNYTESIFCFRILMVSLFFMTINSPLHGGMLSANKEKVLLKIIVFQLSVNIIGNLLLIPEYGIIGSSIATVLTEALGLPLYIYNFRKILPVKLTKNFIIAALAVIPMGFFLYYSSLFFIIRAVIGVVIMIFFVIILRGYTIDEIINIKKTLFSIEK